MSQIHLKWRVFGSLRSCVGTGVGDDVTVKRCQQTLHIMNPACLIRDTSLFIVQQFALGSVVLLASVSTVIGQCGPQPEGNCIECGPYTNAWSLVSCPAVTNSPGVEPTSICQKTNTAPTKPPVVRPAYSQGEKKRTINGDCPPYPKEETNSITYTVGGVLWDPELPATLTNTFSSTAYVNVTSSDTNTCPSPGRVDIGTVTWTTRPEDLLLNASGGTLLSVYFLVENVGLRLYNHRLREFYEKRYFCTSPQEKWRLINSTASMDIGFDPITWGEEHQYSFETTWTTMFAPTEPTLGPQGTYFRERAADIEILPPTGLTGNARVSAMFWSDPGGSASGGILGGRLVSVSMP